ncbi:MAG: universal stress protein [Nitrospirae bacterium]|nr:universal stress protein [Nitrospirota bacterium]NTW65736.1 universal stress protein [Nitrospirota bacterium]
MKIMVAYDGTLQAKEALSYGIDKARAKGGEVVALHVFNSPMFADYDATVNTRDAAKAEAARFVEEAKTIIREKGTGVKASLYSTEGNPEQEMISFAKAEQVDVLLCPPKFKTIISKYQKALAGSELAGEAAKMNVAAIPTKTM